MQYINYYIIKQFKKSTKKQKEKQKTKITKSNGN